METAKTIRAPMSNMPTSAEAESAIGYKPSDVDGQMFIVTSETTGYMYLVVSNGEAFFFLPFKRAA